MVDKGQSATEWGDFQSIFCPYERMYVRPPLGWPDAQLAKTQARPGQASGPASQPSGPVSPSNLASGQPSQPSGPATQPSG